MKSEENDLSWQSLFLFLGWYYVSSFPFALEFLLVKFHHCPRNSFLFQKMLTLRSLGTLCQRNIRKLQSVEKVYKAKGAGNEFLQSEPPTVGNVERSKWGLPGRGVVGF